MAGKKQPAPEESPQSWSMRFPTDPGHRGGKRSGQEGWDGDTMEVTPNVKGLVDEPGEQEAKECREARSR